MQKELYCDIIFGDSRKHLGPYYGKVDLIVTSPPYADARKHHYDSIHPDKYAEWFMTFCEPLFKTLKPSGSLIINIKDKVVNGVRHRYVWDTIGALSKRGWFALDDYIWHKTNPMPGYWPNKLRDGWEYCFHLAKTKKPYFNAHAVKKPVGDWVHSRLANLGKNDTARHNSENQSGFGRDISKWLGRDTVIPSNVLSIPLVGKNKGHPAVFPVDLPRFFVKMLCPADGLVLDPFSGSGTTAIAALQENRNCVLIDNNQQYCDTALQRVREEVGSHVEIKHTVFDQKGKRQMHADLIQTQFM